MILLKIQDHQHKNHQCDRRCYDAPPDSPCHCKVCRGRAHGQGLANALLALQEVTCTDTILKMHILLKYRQLQLFDLPDKHDLVTSDVAKPVVQSSQKKQRQLALQASLW